MANNNKHTGPNVPALRFPEFSGEWERKTLSEFVDRVTRKNRSLQSTRPLTISAQYGLVDQTQFFKKSVAGADLSNYYLLENGEFAYNKSYSDGYPLGAIKRLDSYDSGVLSSLYICFAPKPFISSDYLVQYFESTKWNKVVKDISGEGARNHGLLNVSVSGFFETQHFIPKKDEQDKLASFLTLIGKRIEVQSKIIEELKTLRSSLRQKLLYKNDVVMRPLSDFSELKNGYAFKSSTYSDTGIYNIVTISNVTGERYINLVGYNKIDEIPFDIQSHQILHSGDILISMTGNVGRVSMCSDGNYLLNQRVGLLKLKAEYVGFTEYIFQCLRDISFTNAMKDKGQGAAQQNIGKGDIESFMVPWFNDVRYSKSVSQLLYKLDNIVLIEEQRLSDYSKIKIELLSKMFI